MDKRTKSLWKIGNAAITGLIGVGFLSVSSSGLAQVESSKTQDTSYRDANYVDDAGLGGGGQEQPPPAIAAAPEEPSDFEKLAQASTGENLTVFGRELFHSVPSTFAPGDQLAVSPDYVVGPGDELVVRIWGPEEFNSQLTVDRAGSIYIPKVGTIHVAGLQFRDLQSHLESEVGRTYRNFQLSVNMGRLRSIQIYVVGEAQRPGAYTLSSLSTVLNALFASGGPNLRGSLRRIQIRRAGADMANFDLYDFLLHGDKSKDVRLETGDTIFIPAVGPQVAIAGSVRHPAVYELVATSTVQDVEELAGGFLSTATRDSFSLERIDRMQSRVAFKVAFDDAGRHMPLRDGDVIFFGHISDAYDQTVTIRGNLANPGRFPWHEGMKLSDIIPDKMSLLTPGYWRERNRLGIPVPLFQSAQKPVQTPATIPSANLAAPETNQATQALNSGAINGLSVAGAPQPSALPDQDESGPQNAITIPAPEIDWSYAVIERLDTSRLRNTLVPFNLGKLVQDHDPSQDLSLQPGDTVTILSQRDIDVPQALRTKYVRLEGEFDSAGVYSVGPNDTLADVVRRAGGLTPNAYLYGSNFSRKSAQVFQQQRLDAYVAQLTTDIERAEAARGAAVTSAVDRTLSSNDSVLIAQLHAIRATGRIVLQFTSDSAGIDALPNIQLEDGDIFRVPSRPNTVGVVGAVYGQNVFLYEPHRRLGDYVALAGKPNRIADRKHAFVVRADGSIFSRETAQGVLSNDFDSTRINPGDAIVIPEKRIKPSAVRELLDYSQILSSFGIAAAAVEVLK